MKTLSLLLVMFVAINMAYGQADVESKIISAKIYTQGAELKRTAKLKLKEGKNEFKLIGLSANLDPKTIQISGKDITILSVRHENDYIETNKPEKVKTLIIDRLALLDSLELVRMNLSILVKSRELLSKNMKVIGNDGIGDAKYREALDYLSDKFEENTKTSFMQQLLERDLQKRINKIESQIKSYSIQDEEPTSNIYLVINANKGVEKDILISYAVSEAGWFPTYDIRATNVESPLSLTYKARIFQNTGVDWKDVKLILSSGDLESSGTAPLLNPLLLGRENSKPYRYGVQAELRQPAPYDSQGEITGVVTSSDDGLPLVQVTVMVKGTTIGTPTDLNGKYSLQIPNGAKSLVFSYLGFVSQEIKINNSSNISVVMVPDATSLGEVVVTGVAAATPVKKLPFTVASLTERQFNPTMAGISNISSFYGSDEAYDLEQKSERVQRFKKPIPINYINYQTSFVYKIKHPYSIPSTGQTETVEIQTLEVYADYKYSTSPKARENAFLVAEIPDWEELKLLDGESNLYFEESFVGKSIIDTNIGKDTLDISLGKDEGIVVSRKRLKEFEKNKIFSNKKRDERTFEITVVNTKSTKINLNVYDQLPIIPNKNYKVNIVDIAAAKHNKETGLLTWELQLEPGAKKVIRFRYSVDYPKYMDLDID
ncbi:mucoidy inhibitor MuiA family protein [Roseivirga sp.]|uniref:DUF4139 domain-containing protein n=1 Tax=Roseivirga sp. TaxID=1964215 RepID=UPI003B8EAD90